MDEMKDSGERQSFETGAVRDTATGKPRPDLISPHAAMREGIWMGLGAEKYQPRNWEKGIPISRCIASLERHLVAYKLGLRDEDHMAAVRTNAGFILHFEEEIKAGALPATLDDMPRYGKAGYPSEAQVGDNYPPRRRPEPPRHRCPRCKMWTGFLEGVLCTSCLIDQESETGPRGGLRPQDIVPIRTENKPGDTRTTMSDGTVLPGNLHVKSVERCVKMGGYKIVEDASAIIAAAHAAHDADVARGMPHQDEDFIQEPAAMCGDWAKIVNTDSPECPGSLAWWTGTDPRGSMRGIQKPFTVYLCGPITGDPLDHAWRDTATHCLSKQGIVTLNPLRGKDTKDISNQGMSYKGELASSEMADRDKMDVEEADLILAHFPYAPPRQSIGSLMEMGGAAIGMKKPIVLCTYLKEFTEHLFTRRFCIIEPVLYSALELIADMAKTKGFLTERTYQAAHPENMEGHK